MNIPTKESFTAAATEEGGFKTSHDQLIDFLSAILGTVSEYLKPPSGTEAGRPGATESGWLRFNSDRDWLEISNGNIWEKILSFTHDLTWKGCLNSANKFLIKLKSGDDNCLLRVENSSNDYVDIERNVDGAKVTISDSGTFRVSINGTVIMSVDPSGNLITSGNLTGNGVPT